MYIVDEQEYEGSSKGQLKREAAELVLLGKRLAQLHDTQLSLIEMPNELSCAIREVRHMHKNAAKRHYKFIGKLLRSVDISSIQKAANSIGLQQRQETDAFHKLEELRDRLLEEGDAAMSELISEFPDMDRQKLRQLIRQANKEKQQGKQPKASRALFKYLRDEF
ncbi:MAG: ribosome biogenesis factor YjgA [Mariprofundaceae bacterium]